MHVFREPFAFAAQEAAIVEWQPQPLWAIDCVYTSLTIRTYPVTIGLSPTLPLAKASLEITTHPMAIALRVVELQKVGLLITAHPMQVTVATVVTMANVSLEITPHALTIARPKAVAMDAAHMTVTPHAMAIVLTYNLDFTLAHAALAVTPYPMDIYRVISLGSVELIVTPYRMSVYVRAPGIQFRPDASTLVLRPDEPTLTLNV